MSEKPSSLVYLVLAASGSGKTTLTTQVVEELDDVACIRFGDFLQAEIGTPRQELRHKAGTLLDEAAVNRAVIQTRSAILSVRSPHLLLECRNVAVRDYGLFVGMYARRLIEGLPCAGVLFLDVSAAELERRTAGDPIRRPWREGLGESLLEWERAAAVYLAGHLNCPLYVLDGDRNLGDIVQDLISIVHPGHSTQALQA